MLVIAACTPRKNDDGKDAAPLASASGAASAIATLAPSAPAEPASAAAAAKALAHVEAQPKRIGTCAAGGEKRFTLAHVNDLQARYSDRIGGKSRYAYIAGFMNALKKEHPATLVLDAGDDYEKGALAELRSNGETTRQMVQALPIDVRTIGNHDFAYGDKAVLADVAQSKHPVLAANIEHDAFQPYARVDVGCVRVGIVGLVTQGFGADDRQIPDPYCAVFPHDDKYVAIAQKVIDAHRAEVDVMIALTHLGFGEDQNLAARTKGLDLVVGGHSEDLVEQPAIVKHQDGAKTFVLQAGKYSQKIGRGEIVVKPPGVTIANYRIVNVDEKLPADAEVDALAKKLEKEAVPDAHVSIAKVRAQIRQGKQMAELVRRAAVAEWNADIVVVGHDDFFAGLERGDVTLQRLYDTVLVQRQPSGTTGFTSLWMLEMSAEELATLAKKFRASWRYVIAFPQKIDSKKKYKVVFDKRALTFPTTYLGPDIALREGTFAGEIIDLLEKHARARTAQGLTLD